MPILCEPASTAGELLSGIDGEVRKADNLAAAAKLLDSDPQETLVIIGPRAVTGDALAFAAALRLARPAVGVILARREVDVALLSRALQSGVRDVVPVGDDAAMAAACRRSYEVSRRMLAPSTDEESTPGQIVTVFAAKGGFGKTSVAINLGVSLAKLGAGPRLRRRSRSRLRRCGHQRPARPAANDRGRAADGGSPR